MPHRRPPRQGSRGLRPCARLRRPRPCPGRRDAAAEWVSSKKRETEGNPRQGTHHGRAPQRRSRQLIPNPDNPRRTPVPKAMDEQLIASIRAVGIIQPPVVPDVDGTLVIMAGHRRVEAAIAAGNDRDRRHSSATPTRRSTPWTRSRKT